MNWVGGSRSRIILKQERRKQKEFFEKKKLKSKMKLLGDASPKNTAVSLDLLNLYVVNQISTKKDNTENRRKPVHIDINENVKIPVRRHNIELPTSPLRTQVMSNLHDIQNRLQKQVLDSRRQHLSEKVKYQHNLSQVTQLTYADSSMKHEDNPARAFTACPLSSPGFWSSNCTQLSEENFNANLMGDTWEQTDEKKLQNLPGNSSDQQRCITKPPSQCIFRKSDTVPQDLFKPLHRKDYMNSTRNNPVIITSNESKRSEEITEPLFDVVKETAELKAPQDGSDCSFLALFEDESQPIHNNTFTKHFNPFVNQSSTAIFFIDPDDRNQMTNKNHLYDTREVYPAINAKPSSVDRHLEGVFTAPEQFLLKCNNASSASYRKTSGLHKTHLQGCHGGQHYFIPSEKKEKPANLEKNETFAYHHDQQINLNKNLQKYLIKKSVDECVNESAWRQSQRFGFEEMFTTTQEKESKFGVSSNLHKMETDVEGSLSSQSPSYSPRQADSCFSSSPDMSEEEDTAKEKEHLTEQPLKIDHANLVSASASAEPLKTSHASPVPLQPSSILTREAANCLQEELSSLCATEQENNPPTALPEHRSLHQALQREHVTGSTRCDVWSQTVTQVRKVDASTQCDTTQVCSCGHSLPSACSPRGVPPPSAAGTAGGHKMPAQEELQPAGTGRAAGVTMMTCSPEAEYLSVAGRRTLEVLNYIDLLKERNKQ